MARMKVHELEATAFVIVIPPCILSWVVVAVSWQAWHCAVVSTHHERAATVQLKLRDPV